MLNRYVDVGQLITNPFRSDNNPGCWLSEYDNILWFTDFSGQYGHNFNCIHAVNHFTNKGLSHAARFIDHYLTFNRTPVLSNRQVSVLNGYKRTSSNSDSELWFIPYGSLEKPEWTQKDIEYWQKRKIGSGELIQSGCYSVKRIIHNNQVFQPVTYPCFAYTFPNNNVKIYQPFSKKEKKWFSSTDQNDVWVWNHFSMNKVIITKSFKDGIILSKIFPEYRIEAFQNEGSVPDYRDYSNYKEMVILFDNDIAGVIAAFKIQNVLEHIYSKVLFYPKELGKDTDEVFVAHGTEPIKRLIYGK